MKMERIDVNYGGDKAVLAVPSGSGNVVRKIRQGRFYEQRLLEYIQSLNLEGSYIDVGANIGNHTVFFGLFTRAKKIHAIEANPRVVPYLKSNITSNKLAGKVKLHTVAAGKRDGRAGLQEVEADQVGGTKVVEGDQVDIKAIDSLRIKNVVLVKIDIEGYEMQALKGMRKIIERDEPELFIEVTTRQNFADIFGFLQQFGYRHIKTYNNSATAHFSQQLKPERLRKVRGSYPVRRITRAS